jgi:hypothetical protein
MKKLTILLALVLLGVMASCTFTTSTNTNSTTNSNSSKPNSNGPGMKPDNANSTSTAPKANPEMKAKASTIASSGEYSAGDITTDNAKGTGGCECASKVLIKFQPGDKSMAPFSLCVGKAHPGVADFEAIHSGDLVQFVASDTPLDGECSDNPASYLRVKKGE